MAVPVPELTLKKDQIKAAELQSINHIPQIILTSDILDSKSLNERLEIILQHIRKHPVIYQLMQKILSKGDLTINFPSHLQHTATCCVETNTISLNPNLTKPWDILWGLVFEICNLSNPTLVKNTKNVNRFIDFCLKDMDGFLFFITKFPDPIEFTKAIEKDEYLSNKLAVRIMKLGITKYGWPEPDLMNAALLKDCNWNEWWENVIFSDQGKIAGLTHAQSFILDYYNTALKIIENNKTMILKLMFEPRFKNLFHVAMKKYKELLQEGQKIAAERNNMFENPRAHALSILQRIKQDQYLTEKISTGRELPASKPPKPSKPLTFSFDYTVGLTAIAGAAATFLAFKFLQRK